MTVIVALWLLWPVLVLVARLWTRPRPRAETVTTYATVAMFGLLTWVAHIFVTLLLAWLFGADTVGSDIDWSLAHVAAGLSSMVLVTPILWRVGGVRF